MIFKYKSAMAGVNEECEDDFVIEELGEDPLVLHTLYANDKFQGHGRAVIEMLKDYAQKEKRCVICNPWPTRDGGLDLNNLRRWYERRGFFNAGDYYMFDPR